MRVLNALFASALFQMLPVVAHTQSRAQTLRGRVVDDSAKAIALAQVVVTRAPDRMSIATKTDSAGRFVLVVDQPTGDYLIHVAKELFVSARRRVEPGLDVREIVADFVLRRTPVLATVNVRAQRAVRATTAIPTGESGTGASERWQDGAVGQLPPFQAGDIGGIASTSPGVAIAPDGSFSSNGLSGGNLITLNGFEFAGIAVPRLARLETRVSSAVFDATRGGFSGANVDVRLGPGDRNFQRRSASLAVQPQLLQWSDPLSRSLGASSRDLRGSLGADGELVRGAVVYNVAMDAQRSTRPTVSLETASASALVSQSLMPLVVDSALQAARAVGVPLSRAQSHAEAARTSISWLARFDDVRDSLRTTTLTSFVNRSSETGIGLGPTASSSSALSRSTTAGGAQLVSSRYVGTGSRALWLNRLAISGTRSARRPELSTSAVVVLLPAVAPSATVSNGPSTGLGSVRMGGGDLRSDESRWITEAASEVYWNVNGRIHRLHATATGRVETAERTTRSAANGSFLYPDLSSLAGNRPASFNRLLGDSEVAGGAWNVAAAVSDEWTLSPRLVLIYGLRAELRGTSSPKVLESGLQSAVSGAAGGTALGYGVSPRAGFTYTYRTARNSNTFRLNSPAGRFTRNQIGVIRGGIGEFVDLARPGLTSQTQNGEPLAPLTESCVGAAVPVPDWISASSPAPCRSGGQLSSAVRSLSLIERSFDVPRSWRASLNWTTAIPKATMRIDLLASRTSRRPGVVDGNFSSSSPFRLPDEDERPVFARVSEIDASSAAIAALASRARSDLGSIWRRRSDLRGASEQITVSVSPDPLRWQQRIPVLGAVSYTLQRAREEARGFDATTASDPRLTEWAPSALDARHIFVVQAGLHSRKLGTFTTFWRFQSGLPYTPIVGRDINGDGLVNDRAYVPGPMSTRQRVSTELEVLLATAPSATRECLSASFGRIAAPNSCRGPWSQRVNFQWMLPGARRFWGRPVTATVYLQNVIGGLDRVVHGSSGLRGWGSAAVPDPVLLVPRSFDPSSRRYAYSVNPRFGETRAFRTGLQSPVQLSIDVSMDLSVPNELQSLRRALEPMRVGGGWKARSVDSIASYFLKLQTGDLFVAVLSESDSLLLSREQRRRLLSFDTIFVSETRARYRSLARFLSRFEGGRASKEALDSIQSAGRSQKVLFWSTVDQLKSVLDPAQLDMLPLTADLVRVPIGERMSRNFGFGFPVSLADPQRRTP